jgi:ATP-dependent RNA helicase HrpB
MSALPIDEQIPEILGALSDARNLVIEAPPGAGKTTRVPPALMGLGTGEVLVLEPRRIAARMAARRVAAELGEKLGERVGYQVRFDTVGGDRTRLRFLTEGVLTRRLTGEPELQGVDTVVLDEFHERHLDGDVALALLRRLQQMKRPDLRIVVMSATLEAEPIAQFLGGCARVRSEGRLHPVDIRYTPESPDSLEEQVEKALHSLVRGGLDGDVLVFLPGAAEIRRAMRRCAPLARRAGMEVVPLHGDLSPEEQDRAVTYGPRPKVILSTNVAESSITIEGVSAVIDSGVARVAEDSPWTGLSTLRIARVSKASADQRAGRAGRLRPGRVVRLYPEADYVRRAGRDAPEVVRRELSRTLLDLHAAGVASAREVAWLDEPPEAAVGAAERLLVELGAVTETGGPTAVGRRMARLPLPPRLARLVIEAEQRGAGADGCDLAAVLSAGDRLPAAPARQFGPSDLLVLADGNWQPRTRRLAEQIRRRFKPQTRHGSDEALLMAVLRAFPDRVARRRGDELLFAAGGGAKLAPSSVVRREGLMVAVDAEERDDQPLPLVRLASAVKAEWLFDLFPDRIVERDEVEWNREARRVERVSALLFGKVAIEESRGGVPDPEAASRLLAEKALEAGIGRFVDEDELNAFLQRISFASEHGDVPRMGEDEVRGALEQLCYGLRSFRELSGVTGKGGFLQALKARLSQRQRQLLAEVAPERFQLPGGRRMKIHYEPGRPPWGASRLQDFFGMKETPRVARGAVPLVLHLLAPNMRPVQMTSDLAGFWERLYPQVRRELRRRYPKHAWPENPI